MSDYRDPPCEACGKRRKEHDGPIELCRRIETVRMIVGVFKQGKLSPRETIKAIEEVLK